ncbi:MAG: DUF935 domain-containing protein [Bacteroidetes bacterium]|nr:DUF935 domain-containing protein [Bacteroidota bacterium]
MSYIKKLYGKLENYVLSHTDERRMRVEMASRSSRAGGSESQNLNYEAETMSAKTLRDWKDAVATASDPTNPDRTLIASLYKNLMLNDHLASVIDSRILYSKRRKFKFVGENDKENTEISWLFERPWFFELMDYVIREQFQGTTLIEFGELTPEGEIAEINEIPQSHFNPIKGIITKNAGDTSGVSYKDGALADYYVQIGKNRDLGMLSQLAPIVLADKLGLGTLLDYIDKFGVPPIFITTDREDTKRLQELYDAASNFRSNHFMVGRGNEKFEIGSLGSGASAANLPHIALTKLCEERISKRVLGGSGMTDEKAYVGSSEIQFRLAKDRFESDGLLFEYVFNTQIKPRLVKISPVYAGLANHYFKWDDTESLTIKEQVENMSKLGSLFEIDPEYVTKLTGIPIIGTKTAAPAKEEEEKEKGK